MKNLKPLLTYLVAFVAFALINRFLFAHPVIEVLAMAAMVLFAVQLLRFLLSLIKPKERKGLTLISLFSSLLHYVAALVILCWGLSILGVNVNAIVASVGIVALIVGFGAESLVADVVTGIFLLFENQYNVGDIVEVNGFRGTVKEIGIRTTSIMDVGGNVKIINNSEMKSILNRSDNISRAVSDIAIPYETDLEALEGKLPQLMEDIFQKRKEIMLTPPRYLGVQQLADSSVIPRFVVDVAEKDIYSGARTLNRDLWLGFRSLGVECPFPQVDVHSK
jgi:small conductance mechanosensitive channel